MPRRHLHRALATLGLLAVAATACGSGSEDAQVLGEQVTREVSASGEVSAEPVATTTTTPPETTTTTAPPATTTTTTTTPPAEPARAPRDSVAPPQHVNLTLSLDRTEAAPGETLTGTLTAENTSAEPLDITHPTTCPTAAGLYAAGARVSEGQACGQAVTPDQLGPGEVRTWPVEIRTGTTAPGTYDGFAGVRVHGGTWYAAPVSVTLT